MDWKAFNSLTDEEIRAPVASDPDAAPILTEEWFRKAELVLPGRKRPISIRFSQDVLDYFMAKGKGYQTRINAVLQEYVRHQRELEVLKALAISRKTSVKAYAPAQKTTRKRAARS